MNFMHQQAEFGGKRLAVFIRDHLQRLIDAESRLQRPADRQQGILQLFIEFRKPLFPQMTQQQTRRRKREPRGKQRRDHAFHHGHVLHQKTYGKYGGRGTCGGKRQTHIQNLGRRHVQEDIVHFHGSFLNETFPVAGGKRREEFHKHKRGAGYGNSRAETG